MFSIQMTASRMASTVWRARHCFGGLRIKRGALLEPRIDNRSSQCELLSYLSGGSQYRCATSKASRQGTCPLVT